MKPGIKEVWWMATGAALFLAVMLIVIHVQKGRTPAGQLARQARRLELVNQIRLSVESAAEAEKRAVMAITDEDSQKFADKARAETAKAEQAHRELEKISKPGELDAFSKAFTELQRVDKEVLDLAVKNTNLKASALAFGPAAAAAKELSAALQECEARVAVWRLVALLPPHIAEESDAKMEAMEAEMAQLDRQIQRSLDNEAAKTAYGKFSELRAQIIKLSRENTNVRSLTLSLTQKRNVTAACQDAWAALQQAIQNEPMPGKAVSPR